MPFVGDAGVVHGGEPRDIEVLHGPVGEHVDGTVLVGHGAGGTVGNDVPVDAVEVGQLLLVVVIVANQLNDGPAVPVLELEGTGADGMVVMLIVAEVGALVEMLGHHGEGSRLEGEKEGTEGLGEGEHHGMVVGSLDALDVLQHRSGAGVELSMEHIGGEDHVLGGERFAVVPQHVVTQLEGPGQTIVTNLQDSAS